MGEIYAGGYKHMEGELAVSDRTLVEYADEFNLPKKERDKIPHGAVILNIGSGSFRTFESELHVERPDLQMVSIDPSLGKVSIDYEGAPDTQGTNLINLTDRGFLIYAPDENLVGKEGKPRFKQNEVYSGNMAVELDKTRKKIATRTEGAVAASAVTLPLKDESVDIAFDFWGPIRYLRSGEDIQNYLLELKRIMKPNAKIYVSYLGALEKAILDNLGLRYSQVYKTKISSWIISFRVAL